MKKIFFALFLFVLFWIGCKTSEEVIIAQLPIINFFNADLTETFGGTVTLSWSVSNSTSVEIDNGIGIVSAIGTCKVKPTQTTIYILTARNTDGNSTSSLRITVRIILVDWTKGMTSYGCPKINGTVKNVSDKGIYNVMITWSAYNNSNIIIDTANGFPANLETIPAGVSAVFEAIFFDLNSWNQVDHLTYTIDWLNVHGIAETFTEKIKL